MTRPRGRPPTPSAMSSPRDPVDTVSISTACWFLPSRMIEPLPKARSICKRAASSALVLSTLAPSTTRRIGWLIVFVLLSQAGSDLQLRPLAPLGRDMCMICSLEQVLFLFSCRWGYGEENRTASNCGDCPVKTSHERSADERPLHAPTTDFSPWRRRRAWARALSTAARAESLS